MSKLKLISILLINILILTNCSSKQALNSNIINSSTNAQSKKLTEEIKEPKIKLVNKKEKTKFLLTNGIVIEYKQNVINTSNGNINVSIPQISGLVDKNLEKNINKTIINDIMLDAKSYISEEKYESKYVSPWVRINANNILSIQLYYSDNCYTGFLYRLTDGKRLNLKEIFTEGTDYIALLNPKIVEGILRCGEGEENILKAPFSSINPNQNFVLSSNELILNFNEGDSGFIKKFSISIPLKDIDDYVIALDYYSGSERKNHENKDLIVRENNIFITNNAEVLKRSNGDIWVEAIEISGLRNDELEKTINRTIQESINEIMGSKLLDSLTKNIDYPEYRIAQINIWPRFNLYGILSIQRNVELNDYQKNTHSFFRIYSFDLVNKKPVDTKNILSNYIKKHPELGKRFSNLVATKLLEDNKYSDMPITPELIKYLDYQTIYDNSLIYFNGYSSVSTIDIVVRFKENTFKGISRILEPAVPLKDILLGSPEEFFAS